MELIGLLFMVWLKFADPGLSYKMVNPDPAKTLKEMVYEEPKLYRLVPVDHRGVAVGDTLQVLIQHRKYPNERLSDLYKRADVVIACWPSKIPQPEGRRKALLNDHSGRLAIKRIGDVIHVLKYSS